MNQLVRVPLKVMHLDLLKDYNAALHHTSDYVSKSLIVRRGQEFKFQVTFNRELRDDDKLIVQLSIGERPKRYNGTALYLNVRSDKKNQPWHAKICQTNGKKCHIAVTSPPDAIIGRYNLLNVIGGYNLDSPRGVFFYVLFNPWCEEDSVFMPDEDQKAEYVLNDSGYLYVGSATHIFEKPWNFGQFEKNILECCMYLLNKSELGPYTRRDPVHVARAMSSLVNYDADDEGVLVGSWLGDYEDGISPAAWTGSVPILQEFYRTKVAVLYGQCWVFSGVLTTVMRCLGIPARSVTTFECAHDYHKNINVDEIYNEMGERLDMSDCVWNYHVWNDVWMKRRDLPEGYDGWQVIDSTPQHTSDDKEVLECGPAPVTAIKEGKVYVPYDTTFVFSEVNADRVSWIIKQTYGDYKFIRVFEDTTSIGKNISTKAVGKNEREDITEQYKFPEGSLEERKAVKTALSHVRSLEDYIAAQFPKSPIAELILGAEETTPLLPGQPIELNIVIRNMSPHTWTVNVRAACHLESYAGNMRYRLKAIRQFGRAEGMSVTRIPLIVGADVYMNAVSSTEDELLLKVNIFAQVAETHENLGKQLTFAFQYPPLKVKVPETASVDEIFTCDVIFKNTLSIPLENCNLYIEGLGIFPMLTLEQGVIYPSQTSVSQIKTYARKVGKKKIVAKLNSTQVKGIIEETFITITLY